MSRRLFINNQEIQFFNVIGKELIQDIVGQKVVYYSVSAELTHADDLYGEATKKTAWRPIEINALVRYNQPDQSVTQFSIDTVYNIEIYFLLDELRERNVEPHVGDFVQYGQSFYEVAELTMPDLVYGQIDHKVQARALCRIARQGQFNVPPIQGNV